MNLDAFAEPIDTERFVVRLFAERDLEGLMDVNGDDAVTAFLPYPTWRSMDDARAWGVRMNGMQDAGRARQLVVVDRADDRAIGAVLVFAFDEGNQRAELGYVLGRRDWRRGVMREVLEGVLARAFSALGARRLEAFADPRNVANRPPMLTRTRNRLTSGRSTG